MFLEEVTTMDERSHTQRACNYNHDFADKESVEAGLEYGMEQWNGKRNGTVNVHKYTRS